MAGYRTLLFLLAFATQGSFSTPAVRRNTLNYEDMESVSFCGTKEVLVTYESTKVQCGHAMALNSVGAKQPKVEMESASEAKKYTLIMFDPDAPSSVNPKCKSYLHWLIGNIQGSDLKAGSVSSGFTVTAYQAPAPLVGTGTHRYRFLVLDQNDQKMKEAPYSTRCGFSVQKFIGDNGFTVVAVNEFIAEADSKAKWKDIVESMEEED